MEKLDGIYEEIKVYANDLVEKVREAIHEGNVRRVIIKDDHGNTFMEIPLTIAALGVIGAPVLAAVGAIATALSHFTVGIERVNRSDTSGTDRTALAARTTPVIGATEDQVDMKDTVPQRLDDHGTKAEDLAGVGEHDSKGG
jgi:hypothetical protein